MNVSEKGIDLIKQFEGCRLAAYKCPGGVLTIGYGHTGIDVSPDLEITQQEAERLLKSDLIIHCNNVEKLVKVPLNQNQFDALVSLEYNIGYGAFKNSTLLKLLNEKKYKEAAEQFERWKYAGGKVLAGLVRRREKEKALFLS